MLNLEKLLILELHVLDIPEDRLNLGLPLAAQFSFPMPIPSTWESLCTTQLAPLFENIVRVPMSCYRYLSNCGIFRDGSNFIGLRPDLFN
jgi:hypothetical protein